MSQILVALGVVYVVSLVYHSGRQEGSQAGWSKAWHRARQRFQRRHRKHDAAQ